MTNNTLYLVYVCDKFVLIRAFDTVNQLYCKKYTTSSTYKDIDIVFKCLASWGVKRMKRVVCSWGQFITRTIKYAQFYYLIIVMQGKIKKRTSVYNLFEIKYWEENVRLFFVCDVLWKWAEKMLFVRWFT